MNRRDLALVRPGQNDELEAARPRHERLARGIYLDGASIYVRAQSGGHRKARRFPLDTGLREMQRWQADREAILRKQSPTTARGALRAEVKCAFHAS